MSPSEVAALGVPKEDGTLDRTHLSPAGSALFGALVAEELGADRPRPRARVRPLPRSGAEGRCRPPLRRRGRDRRAERPLLGRPHACPAPREAGRLVLVARGGPRRREPPPLAEGERRLAEGPRHGPSPRARSRRRRSLRRKDRTDTTIDNGATHTQIRFLARLFAAARDERFRAGALRGLDFLLAAQYPNGGWPQFFPLRDDYSHDVTFNDGAMAGALELLLDVAQGREPFDWADGDLRERARRSVGRGVEAILAAQVVVDGKRTAWGAQHDAVTLEPSPARTFEPVALASSESVGVVRFLMSLPAPSREVVAAVDSAVAWLRSVRIDGLRVERQRTPAFPDGVDVRRDARPVRAAGLGPLLRDRDEPPALLRAGRRREVEPRRDRARTADRLRLVRRRPGLTSLEGLPRLEGEARHGGPTMTDETRTAAGSPSRREFLYAAGVVAASAALPARAAAERGAEDPLRDRRHRPPRERDVGRRGAEAPRRHARPRRPLRRQPAARRGRQRPDGDEGTRLLRPRPDARRREGRPDRGLHGRLDPLGGHRDAPSTAASTSSPRSRWSRASRSAARSSTRRGRTGGRSPWPSTTATRPSSRRSGRSSGPPASARSRRSTSPGTSTSSTGPTTSAAGTG